jgi:hypothetical protein
MTKVIQHQRNIAKHQRETAIHETVESMRKLGISLLRLTGISALHAKLKKR